MTAILDAHPRRLPHWTDWARDLRTWGEAHLQTEHEESEMPSQNRIPGAEDGTLGSRNEAAPQGAETPGGPSRFTSTDSTGRRNGV